MNAYAEELVGRLARRDTYRDAWYLLTALPLGVATFTASVTLLAVGASLAIVMVGLPILAAALVAGLWVGRLEVAFANRFIGARIELPAQVAWRGGWRQTILEPLRSGTAWRAQAWLLLRLPLGVLALLAVVVPPMLAWGLTVAAAWGALYDADVPWRLAGFVGGVAALLVWPHAMRATAALHASAGRGLLGVGAEAKLREAAERTATAEARTDLARELHDSVGHSVTAAVLQASAARRMLATDPAYADQALAAIEQQGRAALEELDRVLAVMRDDGAAGRTTVGMDEIDSLVRTARDVGQPVELRRVGDAAAVPAAAGRDAYRVVQEALTNAMRHAAGAPTRVTVDAGGATLAVHVTNDAGRSAEPSRPGGGSGLAGLAERVRRAGGTFRASATPGGGFEVRAEIPYAQPRD